VTFAFRDGAQFVVEDFFVFFFFVLNSNAWRFQDPVFFRFFNSVFLFLINVFKSEKDKGKE